MDNIWIKLGQFLHNLPMRPDGKALAHPKRIAAGAKAFYDQVRLAPLVRIAAVTGCQHEHLMAAGRHAFRQPFNEERSPADHGRIGLDQDCDLHILKGTLNMIFCHRTAVPVSSRKPWEPRTKMSEGITFKSESTKKPPELPGGFISVARWAGIILTGLSRSSFLAR